MFLKKQRDTVTKLQKLDANIVFAVVDLGIA